MRPDEPRIETLALTANGIRFNALAAGPADGPLVLFLHGFPELARSWRHQLPALGGAGYRAVAPDMRGYGDTEMRGPYDVGTLVRDVTGLIAALGRERAVVVGHDWGAMVANNAALLHPDRFAAVCTMSVPLLPRAPVPPVQMMRNAFGDAFFYIVYFQEPGVADAELNADPTGMMTRMLAGLRTPGELSAEAAANAFANDGRGFIARLPEEGELPEWLTRDELDHYIAEFTRTGFTGGINWYRNMDRNWELTAHLADAKQEKPALFIAGSADPVIMMTPPSIMDGFVTDLRGTVLVEGAGHWVQQERPDEVNAALLDFLADVWPV